MIMNVIRLLRIPQWIKNFALFVPLVFAKHLFDISYLITVILAFVAFCFVSSSVYIFNDIMDVEADKLHPKKKFRPIPSGKISIKTALVVLILLLLFTGFIIIRLNSQFQFFLLGYIILNIAYSIILKHVVIVDILSIAAGFMIRVLAGGFVISVYISSWLILTTMFISLFLAIMKRRSELGFILADSNGSTRKVLSEYSNEFTEQMASISASGVIICYALYSVSERTIRYLHSENLVYTTIFVVFGIFRFMYLVYKKSKGENATEIMLTDIPLIIDVLLYILVSVYIVYW